MTPTPELPEEPPVDPCLDVIEITENGEIIISSINAIGIGGLEDCGDGGPEDNGGGGGGGGGGDGDDPFCAVIAGNNNNGGGGGGDGAGGGGNPGQFPPPPQPPQPIPCEQVAGHPPIKEEITRPREIIDSDFTDQRWTINLIEEPVNSNTDFGCSNYWKQFDIVLKNAAIEEWHNNPFYINVNGEKIPITRHPKYRNKDCWKPNAIKKFNRMYLYKCNNKCYYDYWYECKPTLSAINDNSQPGGLRWVKTSYKVYSSDGVDKDKYGKYNRYYSGDDPEICQDDTLPVPDPPVEPEDPSCECECPIICSINDKIDQSVECEIKIQKLINQNSWENIANPFDCGCMTYQPNFDWCSAEKDVFPLCWINNDINSNTDYIFNELSGTHRLVSTKTKYHLNNCEFIKEIFICLPIPTQESIIEYVKQVWRLENLKCQNFRGDDQWVVDIVLDYTYAIGKGSKFVDSETGEPIGVNSVISTFNSVENVSELTIDPGSKFGFVYTFNNTPVTKTQNKCPNKVRPINPSFWQNFPINQAVCRPLPPIFEYKEQCDPTPTPTPTPTPYYYYSYPLFIDIIP